MNSEQREAVRGLRREALRNYDEHALRAAVCDLALDGEVDPEDYSALTAEQVAYLRALTPAQAVQVCADHLGVNLHDDEPADDFRDPYRAWRDDGDM